MSITIRDVSSTDTSVRYRDISQTLKNRQTVGEGINVLENENAVRQNIRNWLYTRRGQRALSPFWGNSFHEFLFKPVTRSNAQLIAEELDRLPVDVPTMTMVEINIDLQQDETGNKRGYSIFFTYNIPTLNLSDQPLKFGFFQNTGIVV